MLATVLLACGSSSEDAGVDSGGTVDSASGDLGVEVDTRSDLDTATDLDAPADTGGPKKDAVVDTATDLGSDAPVDPVCGADYVLIPAGDYVIGSPDGVGQANEKPQYTATLSAFCMKRTEVTVGQYRAWSGSSAHVPGTFRSECQWTATPGSRESYALNCVTWDDAVAYCTGTGGRLPTESEWEAAARGPTYQEYPWGAAKPTDDLACFDKPTTGSEPVAYPGKDRCHSPYGVCDMAGNVEEWVADWMGPYTAGTFVDPKGPSGPGSPAARVTRGGSCVYFGVLTRSSGRAWEDPGYAGMFTGFRCVRPAP